MSAKETSSSVELPTQGVGDRLKEAREAKKYTQSEVAAQLRLGKEIVVALETHDWDGLHGRTYARGYFANYVRFLGLPFDEMMALFNLEYSGKPSDVNLKHVGDNKTSGSKVWMLWLLLIIVVGVVAYYASQVATFNGPDAPSLTEDSGFQNQFEESVVEPISQSLESEATPVSVEQAMIEEEASMLSIPIESSVLDETQTEATLVSVALTTDLVKETEIPIPESVELIAIPSLIVSVSAACWVEITNEQQKVLLSRVLKPEETVSFDVEMPLNLLIGKAGVTTVVYDDESIDLSPYTEGDIARLTVGNES
jgi:cytoskeleton protein RodZ